jgi:hypothetical protein
VPEAPIDVEALRSWHGEKLGYPGLVLINSFIEP